MSIYSLGSQNSMGWVYVDPLVGDQSMVKGPLMPSIRQIAYELEVTIIRELGSEI